MCGILAILLANQESAVNQELYDGLTVLQHRGQDAAGMVTCESSGRLHLHKDQGFVRDVFKLNNMINLLGHYGLGHCRYPTAGVQTNVHEAQPFVTNIPFGLCLAHNGNITNTAELARELSWKYHVNTDSDTELILSVLADELLQAAARHGGGGGGGGGGGDFGPAGFFRAVRALMKRARGGYAAAMLVNGYGVVAFRDPSGVRPLCFGRRAAADGRADWCAASESVALESLGYKLERDVRPGEAVFFGLDGSVVAEACHDAPVLSPCIFEHVYFARQDSVVDGVSVYRARQLMGQHLADKIRAQGLADQVDVVVPVPDTSRVSALACALRLRAPYEEGLTKNRYIARTFIMPGQRKRAKSVRKKLNPIPEVFRGKRVLLVDDSIVRGTTSKQIIDMCRQAGAHKVYFCSASPPIRYPNVYGIDMPVQSELVAYGRTDEEVAAEIGADWVVYQDLAAMEASVRCLNPAIPRFDRSCFDGDYVTGDIDEAYFQELRDRRGDAALQAANKALSRGRAASDADQDPLPKNGTERKNTMEVICPPSPAVAATPPAPADEMEALSLGSNGLGTVPEEGRGGDGAAPPRGRRIAGANQNGDDHVSSKDFKEIGDRLSGWM